ncbi:MAG: hypothetical protein P0120_10970 [Nitrospira sp.]|nr:hypothetical protein [Nitrospira sp.]
MPTFSLIFLPGVGAVRRWQQEGLFEQRSLRNHPSVDALSEHRKIWYDEAPLEAYETCRSQAGYLNIKTTDASPKSGVAMVVGLHREGKATSLVWFGLSALSTTLQSTYSQ